MNRQPLQSIDMQDKILADLAKQENIRLMLQNILISFLSVLFALIVGAGIIALIGFNPLHAYAALIKGSVGTLAACTISLKKAVPLIFSGLAIAIAFRCSVFNIGVEGQLAFGALAATVAGVYLHLPAVLHIPVVLLCGFAGGMLAALVPAILKQYFNVGVVISTIMFNYIIQFLIQFFIMGPLRGTTSAAATNQIQSTAFLPSILPKPYQMNLGFVIMLLAVVLVYFLLNKTSRGYEMKAVGFNPLAAQTQGINPNLNMFLALLISGGIAGLAGGVEITGTMRKMINGFSTGYGFSGIPIALIARNNPFAIILTGFFFGMMRSGSLLMQSSVGVSPNIVNIIQGLVVAFLCTENLIRYYLNRKGKK